MKFDAIIHEFVKRKGKNTANVIFPQPVGKGKYERKTLGQKITEHIESYHPYKPVYVYV